MLKNKTILITGSSKPNGMGFATAKLAKKNGAKVFIHGRQETDQLKRLAKKINCDYIFCDVSDQSAVKKAVRSVLKKTGKIDVLANCAGKVFEESFLKTTDEEWIDMLRVNLLGVVHFCQAVIPSMKKNKYGRIVNVASIRGHQDTASPTRPAYSASKAAVVNLTSSLAKAYGPDILINVVSPGFTMTDMSKYWTETGWKQAKNNLLGRANRPSEIAEAILFLAQVNGMTGQILTVDGGYSMKGK